MEIISYGIIVLFGSIIIYEVAKLLIGSYKDKQNGKS